MNTHILPHNKTKEKIMRVITSYDIDDAYCQCGDKLVSWRGILDPTVVLICMSCEDVAYELKLVKIRKEKIDKRSLNKAKNSIRNRNK